LKKLKGQTLTLDLVVALSLFLFLILLVLWAMDMSFSKINTSKSQQWNYQKVVDLSINLFETEGIPSNWKKDNVDSIGLLNEYGTSNISWDKFLEFEELYNNNKSLLLELSGLKNDEDIAIVIGEKEIGDISGWDREKYEIIKLTRIKTVNGSSEQCHIYVKMRGY